MNLKSLTALTLAASAAPLASAGLIAYGVCQTGTPSPHPLHSVLTATQAVTPLPFPATLLLDSPLG